MNSTKVPLDSWIERVRGAGSADNLWVILDEFRTVEWTDEERAKMSHAYMQRLASIVRASAVGGKKAAQVAANDGPVWYEKM
jgi:hypothetical protein